MTETMTSQPLHRAPPASVLSATEQALRERLDATAEELKQCLEQREAAQERVAQVRLEQHRLKIALGGFERARTPRRRNVSNGTQGEGR